MNSPEPIVLDGHSLTFEKLIDVARNGAQVRLSPESVTLINRASSLIENWVENNRIVYGVTTGFGDLATVTVDSPRARLLQENLIRSHAVGVGDPLPEDAVRAIMLLRLNGLIRGHSGITIETLSQLVDFLNLGITPVVPEQGSVGASGDLCPLSHIAIAMMGEGEVYFRGERMPADAALIRAGLKRVRLHPKEGLALNNGTAALTGIGALAVYDALTLDIYSLPFCPAIAFKSSGSICGFGASSLI